MIGEDNKISHILRMGCADFPPGEGDDAHSHGRAIEMIVVLRGEVQVVGNNSIVTLGQWEGVVLGLDELHSVQNNTHGLAKVLHFFVED